MNNRKRIEHFCAYHSITIVSLDFIKKKSLVCIVTNNTSRYWRLHFLYLGHYYIHCGYGTKTVTKNTSAMLQKIKGTIIDS